MADYGKKTERKLMRFDEDTASRAEALSRRSDLPLNWIIRACVRVGLEHFEANGFYGISANPRQHLSTRGNRQISARELSSTSGNQRLPNQLLLPNTGAPVPVKKRRSA